MCVSAFRTLRRDEHDLSTKADDIARVLEDEIVAGRSRPAR